jgi:tetratricopeptide (TPR) repeat protein
MPRPTLALLLACAAGLCAAAPAPAPAAAAWHADLRVLAEQMPARHRNLFHSMSRVRFDAAVAALDAQLDTLPRHRVIVEMARIAALAGDGHTNVAPTRDPRIAFHAYPLALYFFDDGLYVRAADQAHAGLVGAKVLRIGRRSADEAYRAVREIVGRDNEQGARFFAPHLLVMPEVLEALDIEPDLARLTLEVEQDGRRRTVALTGAGPAEMMPPDTDVSWMPRPGWVDARAATPLWLRDAGSKFRYDYLADERLLYVQVNQIGDEAGETLAQFAARLQSFIAGHDVDKLALDLRLNRGGNGDLNRPLVAALIKSLAVDRPGHLFALIGRGTYSAAQFLVNDLEKYTQAVFVGEPTGGKPNSYGDSRKIVLPASGVTVRVSTLWWQGDERDRRPWTAPEVAADLRFADYAAGRDPALEAVRRYRPAAPLAQALEAAAGDAAALAAAADAWHAEPANRYRDAQRGFLDAGYALLRRQRAGDAVRVFSAWATRYPDAANAHDSLGEAYLAQGDRERALAAYRRALALDPASPSANDAVRRLESSGR